MSEKKMRQFELKMGSGPHIDRSSGDRVVYEPGEVIHTEKNLDALFPHKFIELGISKKATIKKKKSKLRRSEEEPTSLNDEDDEVLKTKKLKSKKKKDEEKVDDEADEEEEVNGDDDIEEESEDEAPPPRHPKFGKDVTKDFADAVKADLKVFKKKKGYTVVDSDEPTKALSSSKAKLKSPTQVADWIAAYRKGGS